MGSPGFRQYTDGARVRFTEVAVIRLVIKLVLLPVKLLFFAVRAVFRVIRVIRLPFKIARGSRRLIRAVR